MLSLLSEVHFWTLREDINISHSDFGAFRFYDKKSNDHSISFEGKKSYAEQRGHVWVPQNKRPVRLKENLKELEEHLSQQRVVLCQWRDCSLLQIMFGSGLFVNIHVNVFTGDPISITFDKFLVGKLSDYVVDVVLTKSHLICSYNDSQLTLVYFAKPTLKRTTPRSFGRLDPRVHSVDLAGPTGRRLERKLACNVSGDMVVVWWHSSHDEVYPWSPVMKDQDRANVLVYGVSGLKADLLCHHRSEFDLLSISFSQIHSNVVRSIEQKVSRNGDVTVESSSYQVSRGSMQRTSAASISLPTHVCCHSLSPLHDKLLLGCIDGSLVLYDEALGVTHVVKAAFIPSTVSWHPDGGIFVVSNERCQFQILDAALATLKQQLLSEDVSPSNLLDITSYFRIQPTLRSMLWNRKAETNFYGEKFAVSDCLLLLLFERGPLASLRFVGGGGLSGDIHSPGGFTFDSLVTQYLWADQVDRAINLLLTLNWDIAGSTCLSCLQRIVNHLFKVSLTSDCEVQIQTVLGCFHMPIRPMCPATIEEFKAPVRDLTRRFFHHLLRYKLFEKAFRLAIDLGDRDLFMDIHFSAKRSGLTEIADAAFKKAEQLETSSYASSTSGSSHSDCSRTSCSECSDSTSLVSDSDDRELGAGENVCLPQPNPTVNTDLVGKIITEGQQHSLSSSGNRQKLIHSRPPLPVVSNLNTSMFSGSQESEIYKGSVSMQSKSVFVPPMWDRSTSQSLSWTDQRNGANNSFELPIEQVSSQPVRPLAPQIERPKVKFCDTVTQITLPDRLHTLPEEEEESHVSDQFLHGNPPCTVQNDKTLLLGPSRPLSSFTYSANSVGIPIVHPTQFRLAPSERRHIDFNGSQLPSHFISRAPNQLNSYAASPAMQQSVGARLDVGMNQMRASIPSGSSSYYHGTLGTNKGKGEAVRGCNTMQDVEYSLSFGAVKDRELSDSLGSEELSALLPGSRKPLTSGIKSFDRSLPSVSSTNGPQKSSSVENAYFINCNSSVHDLSEEEENNGSIKIVHFGVV